MINVSLVSFTLSSLIFSPLMMITQKVTTLAFQVHDGEKSLMQFFCEFFATNCRVTDILEKNSIDDFRKYDSLPFSVFQVWVESERNLKRIRGVWQYSMSINSQQNPQLLTGQNLFYNLQIFGGYSCQLSEIVENPGHKVIRLHSTPCNENTKTICDKFTNLLKWKK